MSDISKTRIRKFMNNEERFQELSDILLANYVKIKEIFDHCIGISSYPYMSWLEFTRLCTYWKLPGKCTLIIKFRQQYLANVSY